MHLIALIKDEVDIFFLCFLLFVVVFVSIVFGQTYKSVFFGR